VRFHGEQYPLVKNNSAANRARNRRVNIELDRVSVVEKPVEKPVEPAAPAAPAPASASPAAAAPGAKAP